MFKIGREYPFKTDYKPAMAPKLTLIEGFSSRPFIVIVKNISRMITRINCLAVMGELLAKCRIPLWGALAKESWF